MSRLIALALLVALPIGGRAAEPDGAEFFEKKVRPLLAEHCYGCHSAKAKEPKAGLRLDSRAAILKGGARGPAIVPGAREKSRLVEAISYKNIDLQMPPRGKLPNAAIADLTAWVKMGAPWPGGDAPAAVEQKPGFDLQKRKAEHWCWQPVQHVNPPNVRDNSWPLVPADKFILAKLEAAGLKPAPPADRTTWLRRIHFDLIGLPPTPAEIDAFLKDVSPRAYASAVDRLLASPHFGERWARHWLDLVRYAETKGHEFDPIIPNAYQYRDYVIRALNADVPYNQFVTEHIAGDLLPKPRLSGPDGFNESVLGTGFWFLGEEVHSPVDIRADECDRIDNKIDVFSKTFLALTVSCARCHDHKFDAISQKDYYALSGFLLSSSYRQVRFDSMEWNKLIAKQLGQAREKYRMAVQRALAKAIEPAVDHVAPNLLAARAAMLSGKASEKAEVRQWVQYLKESAKDPFDPFHFWAVLCTCNDAEFSDRFAAMLRKRRGLDENKKGPEPLSRIIAAPYSGLITFKEAQLMNEIAWSWSGDAIELREESSRFQPIRWGGSPEQPVLPLRDRLVEEIDQFGRDLTLEPGTEVDHGALGTVNRSGRTFYSVKFKLEYGKVFLQVMGKGRCYAVVDSHKLIAGPLHGRLIRDFDTKGKWEFVLHDLTPYKGHLLHLEVSAANEMDFALGVAVDSESSPTIPRPEILLESLEPGRSRTPEEVAEEYASHVRFYVKEHLHEGKGELVFSSHFAPVSRFVLANPSLVGLKDFSTVVEAARPVFEEQARLEKQVRRRSRLAPAMFDISAVNAQVHIRGSHKALGEVVPRRFLEALAGSRGIRANYWSGRLELAGQVTDPRVNPLIARVIVNRVWHHLFGRGIVASVDNFGVMGDRPTHPELLDFLAERFVEQGWSIKRLIRELVLSATYQQSSSALQSADPENKLLHAARIKRLQGEAIRDAMLALSGRFDAKMQGAPVPIYLGNIPEARGRPNVDGPLDGAGRRSIYIAVRRNFLSPFMLAFDTPSPFSAMGRRSVSNVPAQALILMNDPFVHQQAERWGRRVAAAPGDVGAKVERMYLSAFARRPTDDELRRSRAFIEERGADARAWGELGHVLFNVKEFIYVP